MLQVGKVVDNHLKPFERKEKKISQGLFSRGYFGKKSYPSKVQKVTSTNLMCDSSKEPTDHTNEIKKY